MALLFSDKSVGELAKDWQSGLWKPNLLAFAFQMMLMLVLGHVLALSEFVTNLIFVIIKPIKNTAQAAALVTLATIVVALMNWGLGLIFGAILARKLGEKFSAEGRAINYPLIAAGGYVGLMVWHGGWSGSALAKVAEQGHLQEMANNSSLPNAITYVNTVLSPMNLTASISLLIFIPGIYYLIGRKDAGSITKIAKTEVVIQAPDKLLGAEKLEHHRGLSAIIGWLFMALAAYTIFTYTGPSLGFVTPNFINFSLLGLGFILHKNINSFLLAVNDAIKGASGILLQFPLYFGILALLQAGGLIEMISNGFIAIADDKTMPILTFLSAGLVNIFVPSGGGQWAIQGPIIIEAATKLEVPLNKMIMALAYGDQLTNMLQPFWALPLLSITGLKAKDILPYTLILFLMGLVIFGLVLLLF